MMTRYDADKLIWTGIQQPDDSFRKLFVQKGADEKTVDKLQRYLFDLHGPIVGYVYLDSDDCQLLTGRAQAYFAKYPEKVGRLVQMTHELAEADCYAFPIIDDTIDLFEWEDLSLKKANKVSQDVLAQAFHRQMLILSHVEDAYRSAGLTDIFISASDELMDTIASYGYEYDIDDVIEKVTAPIPELRYYES